MAIGYQLLHSATAYRSRMPEVAQLFSTVFDRPFPGHVWGQWYLNNPYGNPYVALGYHAHELVAHHALVPQVLVGDGGKRRQYLLSMSTMIQRCHRNLGGFLDLVNALHEAAAEAGTSFVLAFPNSSSAPLFEKFCGYKPIVQTDLCNWKLPSLLGGRKVLGHGSRVRERTSENSYPGDRAYWNWRTQYNHAKFCTVGEALHLVYKVIEPGILMLLDACAEGQRNPAECLASLAIGLGLTGVRLTRYHAALLGIADADLTSHEGYVVRCFGFALAQEVPNIRFSLLLSDVF